MGKESNKIARRVKIALINRDMSQADIAKQLGLTRQAVYMALKRGTKTGKVAEWIQKTLKIDLKKTA
jgi:predicted transcriptional regulator